MVGVGDFSARLFLDIGNSVLRDVFMLFGKALRVWKRSLNGRRRFISGSGMRFGIVGYSSRVCGCRR